MKWQGGKGSMQRPVDPKRWESNFERAFGKKKRETNGERIDRLNQLNKLHEGDE